LENLENTGMLFRIFSAGLFFCTLPLTAQSVGSANKPHLRAASVSSPVVITIHAHRFAFDPAQITLTKGKTVELHLVSDDVHHSLIVGSLGIHADMLPGQTTSILVTPYNTGDFQGDCGHFCGMGHNKMHLRIRVVNP
jgi:cytochrome c oxidase subunit 2